ncbi:MAG: hypothetical protein HOH74_21605, partial [Gemmatimonadetes bacterium]|nr:hypothetical protein [Gemmatimonadota bacterium]
LGLVQRPAGKAGWDLAITDVRGSLLRGMRLHEIRAEGHGSWVEADTIEISLWRWAVDVHGLRVRWHLMPISSEATRAPAKAPSIPDYLPEFRTQQALIDVFQGDSVRWQGHGLDAHWRPPGRNPAQLDLTTSGTLVMGQAPLSVSIAASAVPHGDTLRVHLQDLSVIRDKVGVGAMGSFGLGLAADLPIEAALDVMSITTRQAGQGTPAQPSQPPTFVFNGSVSLSGQLRPLSLAVEATYEGTSQRTGAFEGEARARVDTGAVHVDSITAGVADGALAGTAEFGFDGVATAQARLTGVDVSVLQPPLGGRADAIIDYSSSAVAGRVVELVAESSALTGITPAAVDLRIQATFKGSTLKATARSQSLGVAEVQGTVGDSMDLAVHGELDAAPWLGQEAPFSIQGTVTPAGWSLRLQADSLPYGADLAPLHAELFLHPDRHLDVKAQVAGQQLVAAASLDLTTTRFDTLRLSAHRLNLARWSPGLGGVIAGTWQGQGPVNGRITTAAGLRLDSLQWADWRLSAPLYLTARSDGGRLDLAAKSEGADLSLWADADSVHLAGDLTGLRIQRHVDSSGPVTLGDPTRDEPETSPDTRPDTEPDSSDSLFIRGKVRAAAPWQALRSPTAWLAIDSAAVTIGGLFARSSAPAMIRLAADSLDLEPSRWETSFGALALSARRAPRDGAGEARWSVEGDIDSLRLDPWPRWQAEGAMAQVRIEGTLPYPRIEARVSAEGLNLNEQPLGTLIATVDLDEAASNASLTLGDAARPALQMQLTAPIHLLAGADRQRHAARLIVTTKGFEARPLVFGVTDDSTSLRVSGKVDVSLPLSQLAEGADWSHWRGEMAVDEFRLLRPAGKLRLVEDAVAQLHSGALTVDGLSLSLEVDRLDSAKARVVGSARLSGVLDTVASDLRLRLRDIDLRSAVQLFAKDPGLGGLVSGEAVFTGTLGRPALDIEAEARLDELGLATLRIRGRPLGWNLLAKWRTPAQDELSASIGIPPDPAGWPDWAGAKMRLRSSGLELTALLDQWGELDDLAGHVQVDLSVVDFIDPKIRGQIDVSGLQLALLDMTPGYHFGAGIVRFEGDAQGHLEGFAGTSTEGSGRLELQGDLLFSRLHKPELSLHLLMDGVPYRYADIFHAEDVDADITWVQAATGNRLSGFLRLKEPVAQVQLLDLTAPVPPPPAVQNELLERTTLDLFIDIDDLQTQSEISDVTLDGGIRLYGTLSKPRFQGELDITEGHLLLLSRRFEFDRGRIITDQLVPTYSILDIAYDPLLLDPELDLQATALVIDTGEGDGIEREVTFELRGTARETAPLLTSPGLGDTEVMNLLAFGDPLAPSAGGEVLAVAAGQLLLSRQARKFGLDEFQLLSSGSVLGATIGKPSLRVGKYIESPLSVWLRYEGLTSRMSTGQLEAEYRITNLLKIDARTNSDRGVYGIGLVLEKDF